MNAGEMVTKLRLAMGDEVEPYVVSTQTIFEWLSDAYLRIQVEFEQWKFFHTRGLILTTAAGTAEYTLTNVKEISKDSVYCNRIGETARYPMYLMEYEEWVAEEQINLQRAGNPMYFIRQPDDVYRIEPEPTEIWQVNGDVWYRPAAFTGLTDTPIWVSEYRDWETRGIS